MRLFSCKTAPIKNQLTKNVLYKLTFKRADKTGRGAKQIGLADNGVQIDN